MLLFVRILQKGLKNVFDEAILAALEPPEQPKKRKCCILWFCNFTNFFPQNENFVKTSTFRCFFPTTIKNGAFLSKKNRKVYFNVFSNFVMVWRSDFTKFLHEIVNSNARFWLLTNPSQFCLNSNWIQKVLFFPKKKIWYENYYLQKDKKFLFFKKEEI